MYGSALCRVVLSYAAQSNTPHKHIGHIKLSGLPLAPPLTADTSSQEHAFRRVLDALLFAMACPSGEPLLVLARGFLCFYVLCIVDRATSIKPVPGRGKQWLQDRVSYGR